MTYGYNSTFGNTYLFEPFNDFDILPVLNFNFDFPMPKKYVVIRLRWHLIYQSVQVLKLFKVFIGKTNCCLFNIIGKTDCYLCTNYLLWYVVQGHILFRSHICVLESCTAGILWDTWLYTECALQWLRFSFSSLYSQLM